MPVSTHKNATWKIQWYPVANMNIRESFVKLLGRLAHLAIQEMKKKQELSGSIQLCQRTNLPKYLRVAGPWWSKNPSGVTQTTYSPRPISVLVRVA